MTIFGMYFSLGLNHILEFQAYDHILFLLVLCAVYVLKEWKQTLMLVTAFTIGHATTLALASLQIIIFPTGIIEVLIPTTILITAIANIIHKKTTYSKRLHYLKYLIAMFFGLIHGLGFSHTLRALLGKEQNIIKPLFAFNLGIEAGQIIIVLITLSIAYLFINLIKVKRREWNLVISGMGLGISIILIIENIQLIINN